MAPLRPILLAVVSALAAAPAAQASLAVQGQGAPSVVERAPADGMLAAGDTVDLTQTLLNSEPSLTSVTGRLTTSTPGVTISRSGSAFPDASFGATTANTNAFVASIGNGVACGTNLDFGLELTADQGTTTLPITVETGLAGPLRPNEAVDVPRAIPDGSSIASSFEIATPGLVKNLRVRIGRLTHTYVGDLRLTLEAPDGTTVTLVDRQGGSGDDFVDTTFAASGTPIAGASAPFTGTFKAQGDLTRFNGHEQQGTWTLHVSDNQLSDTGTLVSWGADVAQAVCSGNPIPNFTATPNPVAPGATTTLDASASIDPTIGGSIVRYEWDLNGDGTFESDGGASPTRSASWPSKRTVQVGLRVTDDEGNSDTVVVPVHVTAAPTAALSIAPSAPLTGSTVTLDASGSSDADGTIAGYAWDLDGNGTYERSTGATAATTTQFATPGTHTVRVRVTDDTGATATAQADVTAGNRPPTAAIAVPGLPLPSRPVTFDGAGSADPDGSIVRYEWDLDGDGSYETDTGPASSAARSFPAAGTYTVGLQVTDDRGATAVTTKNVTVDAPPLPALGMAPANPIAGQPVAFSALGSADPDGAIVRYEWDLDGDGSYETDSASASGVVHTYASAGTLTARVRVTDDRGASAVATLPVTVAPAPGGGGAGGSAAGGDSGGGGAAGAGSATGSGGGGSAGCRAWCSAGRFAASLGGAPIQAGKLARTRGIGVLCRVSAPARCTLSAWLPAAAVRQLELAGRRAGRVRERIAARAVVLAAPGRDGRARLVMSAPVRRALGRVRSIRLVVRGTATDLGGRSVALTRVFLIRR